MAKDTGKPADGAAPKVNNRKKYILIAVAAIALIGISVGGTLAVVGLGSSDAAPAAQAATVKKPAIYYALPPAFVVNFSVAGRQRFLQTDVSLLIRDTDVSAALDLHKPAIRNSLVMLFSAQNFDTLQTIEGKEALREQALTNVQAVLQKEIGKAGVEQILFTSFVMQ
jgi:flagellar FliL protein